MMREFGPAITADMRQRIYHEAQALFELVPEKKPVLGDAFAMEDAVDQAVIYEVDVKLKDGQRLRVARTEATARPPFEWLVEITSDIGAADYFKHYLIREHDIMWAERKNLYPIDDAEARVILHDLQVAREAQESGWLKATRKRRKPADS